MATMHVWESVLVETDGPSSRICRGVSTFVAIYLEVLIRSSLCARCVFHRQILE